jgi:hypothetical protein
VQGSVVSEGNSVYNTWTIAIGNTSDNARASQAMRNDFKGNSLHKHDKRAQTIDERRIIARINDQSSGICDWNPIGTELKLYRNMVLSYMMKHHIDLQSNMMEWFPAARRCYQIYLIEEVKLRSPKIDSSVNLSKIVNMIVKEMSVHDFQRTNMRFDA